MPKLETRDLNLAIEKTSMLFLSRYHTVRALGLNVGLSSVINEEYKENVKTGK